MSTQNLSVSNYRNRLTNDVARLQAQINAFAQKVAAGPVQTLRWADDTFKDAAQLELYLSLLAAIDPKRDDGPWPLSNVKASLVETFTHGARYPERSTSPCANLAGQERASVAAREMEYLQHFDAWKE